MTLLFLTLVKFDSIKERGIYTDLIRKFHTEGHQVYVVTPTERKEKIKTTILQSDRVNILKVSTLNLQKTNIIEKGIGTLLVQNQFLSAIKKYFSDVKFNLILYSTPPITFYKIISYIKQRDRAYSYLLLKDIFPQNAVDLGLIKKESFLHRYFKNKEKKLYELSDAIGCMSEANKNYLLAHYPYLRSDKIEVNPNAIDPVCISDNFKEKKAIRKKYQIPEEATVFIYGGNLGIPQGIDFLLEILDSTADMEGVFFLVVGSGTHFNKVKRWFDTWKPAYCRLLTMLPKQEYDQLIAACDVGLIFLDRKFTIPNFPSRLLSYLENKMPVLAATDPNTDVGRVIEQHHAGYWVKAGDKTAMLKAIKKLNKNSTGFEIMRENAFNLLMQEYTVDRSYKLVMDKIRNVQTLL